MKSKTIKTILRKKFNELLESIDDPVVRDLVDKNTIITGGCIASMLLNEPINDFDIYFTNKETTAAVTKYYVNKFNAHRNETLNLATNSKVDIHWEETKEGRIKIIVKSAGIANEEGADDYTYFEGLDDAQNYRVDEYVEKVMDSEPDESKPPYRPIFMSANAITLSGKVQLVIRFYGDADTIHENFDFAHCTSYWESKNSNLVLRPVAIETLLAKELRYVGSKYPLCSIIRTRKFIKRGFSINAGQYLKMCFQLSQLDLADLKVLEEQLIGVDVAYFLEVIDKLKEKGDKVDGAYLTEIIDRIF